MKVSITLCYLPNNPIASLGLPAPLKAWLTPDKTHNRAIPPLRVLKRQLVGKTREVRTAGRIKKISRPAPFVTSGAKGLG
jgi:hypothetical protein